MKIVTSFLVLFIFQTKCLGSPAPKGRESVFSYHANIDVRNSVCNHGIARWVLSGKLRAQHFNDSLVIKLDELRTGIFNGPRENLTLATEKEIPEESKVLMEPFIINKDDNGQIALIVDPNEPVWSINMKRGIASNFQIDTDIKKVQSNKTESSVHGECEVVYKVLPGIIHKVIDYNHCSKKPVVHYGNVGSKPAPGFNSLKMKTVKAYTMRENNGVSQILNILSISQFTYQSMSKSPSKQHIDQYQEFELQEMKMIEESIDTSKLTLKKDIIYEHEKRDYEKEKQYDFDINLLKEEFVSNYDKFMNKMNTLPLQNHVMNERNYINEMFHSLRNIPTESLQQLEQQFIQQNKQTELFVFWSLLPYVGSEHAVDFIVNYNFTAEQLVVNEQVLSKALTTFPTYIDFPLEDKIENYKTLLEIDFSENIPIANIAKLSFANIVVNGYKKKFLSINSAEKYVKLYKEKFLDNAENYEDRMIYLLGLVNMVEFVSMDYMLEIVTNKTENSNLRALALVGFKNHLKDYPTKSFDIFWSLVQNSDESLNMRIRSLDLLLSMELSQEQFNIILEAFLGKSKNLYGHTIDMNEKHIANYFISTLRSMKNEPFSTLKSYADVALKNNTFPDYSRYWTTGNYLISYNDKESNFGSSMQAQLIGDPKTNSLDVLHFTYNHYAMSLDMGTYELYIKIKGIPESIYLKELNCIQQETTSVPELLDIIKKFQFKIKNLKVDAHIEIVVFVDGAAVYAFYDNMDGKVKLENVLEYEISSFFMEAPIHIWYPVKHYTYIPSDLGTELSIMHDMQDIRMKNRSLTRTTINDIQYRSSWNLQHVVQSHNPVISAITRSYKYFSDEKSLKINSFNYTTIILDRKNDSLNWVWDKVMGTEVYNLQAFREYCPKCKRVNEIKFENTENKITDAEYLGIKFNQTLWQIEKDNPEKLIQEFLSTHLSNSATAPYLKSVLMFLHYTNFLYYFKYELLKGNVRTIDFYDTPGNVSLEYNFEKKDNGTNCVVAFDFEILTNPFKKSELLFNISANNIEPDKSSLIWNANLSYIFSPRHKENDNFNLKLIQNLNFEFYPQNSSTIIAHAKREVLLPDMNPNKFSSERPKPATTIINVTYGNIEDPNVYLLYENYTTTDVQMRKAKEMKQYEECKKDSEGLEFVPPTIPCLTVFAAVSEYTHYKVDLKNASDSKLVRILDAFRFDKNKLRVIMPSSALGFDIDQPYRLPDPTAVAYHDTDVLFGMKRKCIITPKQMKTFNEKIVPFDEEKSVVLIECFNSSSLHGVMVDKLNDKNIGFKYISYENTITATVLDNKLIVKLNDTEIHEDIIHEEYLQIHFLADKVIYIIDDQLHIYYNTEYMYIKVQSMYSADICGYCNYLE